MRQIKLSNTELMVSDKCLGTMFFGTKVDEETSFALMDQYAGAGGNFYDTANVYHAFQPGTRGGESETIIGRWLKSRKNRDKCVVATKAGVGYGDIPAGLGRNRILEECDKSLARLGVDYIDIYYLHLDDRGTPLEETLGTCMELIQKGKVRYLGASNYAAWRLKEALGICKSMGLPGFAAFQCWITLLRPAAFSLPIPGRIFYNEEVKDICETEGITILGYETLLRGLYGDNGKGFRDNFRTWDNLARLKTLREVAKEKNISPAQAVYGWMLNLNPRPVPIITASKAGQLEENINCEASLLSKEDMERIDAAALAP
ncbi:MAG: aldo/keto reductase [Treponema sp.]|nr:aldo/keto reductase [Treponema sp.]